jgi:hypothetical protein
VEEKDKIVVQMNETTPPQKFRSAAKLLWSTLSKEEKAGYAASAANLDIDKNQDALAVALSTVYGSLARSGRVGSVEIVSLIAMRGEDGVLRTQRCALIF